MNNNEIQVKVASTAPELEELRPFWSEHNIHPESDIDFVQMLASSRPEIIKQHILVAMENDQPVALLVGRLENAVVQIKLGYRKILNLRLRRLVFVRDGFLGERSERVAQAMIEHILAASKTESGDLAALCNIPAEGGLNDGIMKHCPRTRRVLFARPTEHWKGSLPETYDAFMAARSRKHRGHFRRLFKHLEAEFPGRIKYAKYTGVDDVDPFCKAADQIAQKTYQRGLNAGFIDNVESRRRLTLAAQKGWFRGYVVFAGGEPLAFWGGDKVGDVMHLSWTGYNPAHRKLELGTILYLKMVEDLISQKAREIDYGLGAAHYKERFGDICLREYDTAIYAATMKGFATNFLLTLEAIVNRVGQRVLSSLKLKDLMKRKWRSGLSGKAAPASESDTDAPSDSVAAAGLKGSDGGL
jgi:Acetyltransferase (GNAT) domain